MATCQQNGRKMSKRVNLCTELVLIKQTFNCPICYWTCPIHKDYPGSGMYICRSDVTYVCLQKYTDFLHSCALCVLHLWQRFVWKCESVSVSGNGVFACVAGLYVYLLRLCPACRKCVGLGSSGSWEVWAARRWRLYIVTVTYHSCPSRSHTSLYLHLQDNDMHRVH